MDHYVLLNECKIFEEKVYVGELIGRTLGAPFPDLLYGLH